ncbi:helix-turn-helix domain-containing protein [Thermoplasma sp.]|uniref:helix-turn-helix domain-containing protein n=1 Tax=Thermoplasma sp. TaxID=1973142 RepID=UPI00126EE27A|nr:helix-turn-helix domain-containing protein [Thermoplasma sp.]KAA8921968.1 MAG: hypothetical protein F6Q11_06815 [Thermoplasma sp.]
MSGWERGDMRLKHNRPIVAKISLRRDDCILTKELSGFEPSAIIERLRIGQERTIHRVTVPKDKLQAVRQYLTGKGMLVYVDTNNSLWVEAKSCAVCRFFSLCDSVILGSKSGGRDALELTIMTKNMPRLRDIIKKLDEEGLDPALESVSNGGTLNLTQRERDILKMAYYLGYFDDHRNVKLSEISKMTGVSTASLSEIIRRGTRKIFKYYIEYMMMEDSTGLCSFDEK